MRVKVTTNAPLPEYNCWFVLSQENESQTVHELRKKMVKDLGLNSEASVLDLSMDGFNLLPQSTIQGLLRDGDLINVKVNTIKPIQTIKKRKVSSVEEEEEKEAPVKKPKKESSKKSKKESSKKSKKESSKKSEKESKKAASLKSEKEKAKEKKKKDKAVVEKESVKKSKKDSEKPKKDSSTKEEKVSATKKAVKETAPKKAHPFEGKAATKKRNQRRRLLKANLNSMSAPIVPNAATQSVAMPDTELQIQNLSISHVQDQQQQQQQQSIHLLKKNKNKKKNHLKQMEQRSHVVYNSEPAAATATAAAATSTTTTTTATEPDMTESVPPQQNSNQFGRAFVTFVESERNYKGRYNPNHTPQEYPIHRKPTLFYANQGLTESDLQEKPNEVQEEVIEKAPVEKTVTAPVEEKPLNYEEFPESNFQDKVPSVGAKLAIKTLELTSTYTPEISDWKQVILKELDLANNTVTFEFLPGFGKATTKGGKFDIKKNRKKKYDDWYEQEEEEEEEEEQEEKEVVFATTDIFAMRCMV
ncbi:hypothetical protein BD770DRAFT_410930 [Pilaira anomala]|nr:hypothetical protein BD770DRAFT_410930 [Pilaira anomala]